MAGNHMIDGNLKVVKSDPTILFNADKFDSILFDLATKAKPFTGERYTPGAGVQICYEHLHRYLFATQFLKSGDTVLDLGCGVGYGSILLAGYGVKVIAVDIDPESIEILNEIAKQHQIENLTTITGDVTKLETLLKGKDFQVDLVVCHEVIEHISETSQNDLITLLGASKSPFTNNTILLVSTPDKELYDKQQEGSNPFHAHELTGKEFEELLKKNFKFVYSYEQNTGAVNYLKRLDPSVKEKISFFELGWQDKNSLIPGLGKITYPPAEYIYSVASNSVIPELPSVSLMTDASNQYVRERLSIAAKELRAIETERTILDRIIGQIKSDLKIERAEDLQPIADEISSFKELVKNQAEKIRSSQLEAERVGHTLNLELNKAYIQIRELDTLVNRLKPWHALGGSLLGETPEEAAKEVHRLRSYQAAMNSPSHRFVTGVGKIIRILFPVRLIKRSLRFIEALIKA